MNGLAVLPIVEGHGEVEAFPKLLDRIWFEHLGAAGTPLHVIRPPIRQSRSKLIRPDGEIREDVLSPLLELARRRCRQESQGESVVLMLLDADRDLPCELAPRLLEVVDDLARDLDVACVLANKEIETWFVAAASSLGKFLDLREPVPERPEAEGCGKGWIESRILDPSYSSRRHPVRMVTEMDLSLCRSRSPSFDKLVREFEKRLP